jgi:competence protein ComEC
VSILASRPALLLVAAWIAGVLAGNGTALTARVWATVAIGLLVAALLVAALLTNDQRPTTNEERGRRSGPRGVALLPYVGRSSLAVGRKHGALSLALALIALAAAGAARTRQVSSPPPGDVSEWIGRQVGITGIVVWQPAVDAQRQRFLLEAEHVRSAGIARPVSGRAYLVAPATPAVALGDRVEVFGVPERPLPATNPGGFSAAAWLRGMGCFTVLRLRPRALLARGHGDVPWWRLWPARIRDALTRANGSVLEATLARRGVPAPRRGETIAILHAIVFGAGEAPEVDWPALERQFQDAGILHVLVASGAQVALLLWLVMLLRARIGVRACAGLALGLIWVYTGIAGAEPPMLRAAIAGTVYLIGLMVAREGAAENSLGMTAFLLLVADPLALFTAGFQLTFLAVWGLLRVATPLDAALIARLSTPSEPRGRLRAILGVLRRCQCDPLTLTTATIAANLACAGIYAQGFQRLYLSGFVSSLLAVPLATAILLLGLPVALLNLLWSAASGTAPPAPLNLGSQTLLGLAGSLGAVAGVASSPGWAWVPVFPPGWPSVLLWIAGLFLLGIGIRPRDERAPGDRRRLALAVAPLLCLPMVVGMFLPGRPPAATELTFLDVGQGDCCLARFPDGGTMLVDGGGSPFSEFDVGERVVAPALRARGVGRIDLVVLTHAHEDHVGGLPAILRDVRVGRVLDAAGPVDAKSYETFRALARAQGIPVTTARRGMRIALGPRRAAMLEVLHPAEPLLAGTNSDPNNNSVVLRLTCGGTRVLLTGDAEAAAEEAMQRLDLRADVLKVGHHGSRTSTGDALLAAVRPRLAVISCGRRNSFGHPAAATLSRLERRGVSLFRTDQDGAVVVAVEGRHLAARGTLPGEPVFDASPPAVPARQEEEVRSGEEIGVGQTMTEKAHRIAGRRSAR